MELKALIKQLNDALIDASLDEIRAVDQELDDLTDIIIERALDRITLLKPFTETMTEIGNTFGFKNIELYELEKFYKLELMMSDEPSDKIIKERANTLLFLRNYSDESTIMLEFAKLYIKLLQFIENNKDFGFLVESNDTSRVYSNLDKLVEYLVKYHKIVTDTEVFLTRFDSIEPIELI